MKNTKKNIKILLISFLISLASSTIFSNELPYFKHLLPKNLTKTFPIIHSINQDSFGYIWITTPYCLIRYDGIEYLIFEHDINNKKSISSNLTFSILEDLKKRLWITSDKGLNLFNRKTGDFTHFFHDPENHNSLPSNNLRAICSDKNGNLWIGTKNAGLCKFDFETQKFTRHFHDETDPESLIGNSIWSLCITEDKYLWVAVVDSGIDCLNLETNNWTHYKIDLKNNNSLKNRPWWLTNSGTNKLWIGTIGGGLNWLDLNSKNFHQVNLRKKPWKNGNDYKIISILEESENLIWIGTHENSGLFSFNPISKELLSIRNNSKEKGTLPNNNIFTIFKDRENLLWLGTEEGIALYNKDRAHFRKHHSKLLNKGFDFNMSAILRDNKGILWLGTKSAGLKIWNTNSNTFQTNPIPHNILDHFLKYPPRDICEDELGNIWFATKFGLLKYSNYDHKFLIYLKNSSKHNNIPANNFSKIFSDKKGSLWIGANMGGVSFILRMNISTGEISEFPNNYNENIENISHIIQDLDKNIWISTKWNGLCKLDQKTSKWSNFNNFNKIGGQTINSILSHKDKIWIGTNNGLSCFSFKSKNWINSKNNDQLPDIPILGIINDFEGKLWIYSRNKIIRFDPKSFEQLMFTKEDGFVNSDFNMGVFNRSPENIIFIGGKNGIDCFSPFDIKKNLYLPPVFINSIKFRSKNKEYFFDKFKKIDVNEEDLPLIVNISVLSYAKPELNYIKITENGKPDTIIRGNNYIINRLDQKVNKFNFYGANHDKTWNPNPKELIINFNKSNYFLLYFFLTVILGLFFFIITRSKARKNDRKHLEISQDALLSIFIKFKISKREKEIFLLVIKGKSNKEIEDLLFISNNTVRTHIYNIYRKIGVKNRLELFNKIHKMHATSG